MIEKRAPKSKLKSKVTISIERYEEDMETETSQKKKKEILDLFENSNNLQSDQEFKAIENNLHEACKKGDLELIKIYLSETIDNETKDMSFKIDRMSKTASLFKVNKYVEQLVIPRTVKYESTDYLITSITGIGNVNIKIVKFAEDSAVKTIYGYAFPMLSKVEEIYFPASLIELKERWYSYLENLSKIIISPFNNNFIFNEDKYLLGKSDQNKDEFDILILSCSRTNKVSIPSYIKIISSYAFESSFNLAKVEIPANSVLETIGEFALNFLSITEIYFPGSLKELKDGWCSNVKKLEKIIISPMNNNFIFKEGKYLLGKSDQTKDEFDILLFAPRNIEEVSIPSNIKVISPYAFENCVNLTKIEIHENSILETIGKFSFFFTSIRKIFIPSKVSKICQYAFSNCQKLAKIEIPANSNLKIIEEFAFESSQIKEIYFPTNLTKLKNGWCRNIEGLTKIIISPLNNKLKFIDGKYLLGKSDQNKDEFDVFLYALPDIEKIHIPSKIKIISSHTFEYSKIKEIYIPSNVKIISFFAFYNCKNLTKVEIPTNSNLQTIEIYAFSNSKIKKVFIPSKVSRICEYAFFNCQDLTKVEIPTNSDLQTIEEGAFLHSNISSFFITSKIINIYDYAFKDCENFQVIEISEKSKLKSFPLLAFQQCPKLIIMIPLSISKLTHANNTI